MNFFPGHLRHLRIDSLCYVRPRTLSASARRANPASRASPSNPGSCEGFRITEPKTLKIPIPPPASNATSAASGKFVSAVSQTARSTANPTPRAAATRPTAPDSKSTASACVLSYSAALSAAVTTTPRMAAIKPHVRPPSHSTSPESQTYRRESSITASATSTAPATTPGRSPPESPKLTRPFAPSSTSRPAAAAAPSGVPPPTPTKNPRNSAASARRPTTNPIFVRSMRRRHYHRSSSAARIISPTSSEDIGFCPVISIPSRTACGSNVAAHS